MSPYARLSRKFFFCKRPPQKSARRKSQRRRPRPADETARENSLLLLFRLFREKAWQKAFHSAPARAGAFSNRSGGQRPSEKTPCRRLHGLIICMYRHDVFFQAFDCRDLLFWVQGSFGPARPVDETAGPKLATQPRRCLRQNQPRRSWGSGLSFARALRRPQQKQGTATRRGRARRNALPGPLAQRSAPQKKKETFIETSYND